MTTITQGTSMVSFGYVAGNRRTSLTLPNGIEVAYGYDSALQLTGLTYTLGTTTLGTLSYAYDLAGNRAEVDGTWARTNLPAVLGAATYDAANQIATWGGTNFSYDLNGSLTSDGTRTYTWNARNQLGALGGGASASFHYDGMGRRRGKTITGASTGFLYDGLNAVQELTSGTPSANIVAGLGLDEWFARTDGGGTAYFPGDALGSTTALADSAGTVQTAYTYEPFGGFSTSGASTSNPSAFTGREADGSGLSFYRARYYHPQLQRFVSEDPLGFGAGVNFFAYVDNNPLAFVDPLGLKPDPGFGPDRGPGSPGGPGRPGGPSGPGGPGGPDGPRGPGRPPPPWCTATWCYDDRISDPDNWKHGVMPLAPGNFIKIIERMSLGRDGGMSRHLLEQLGGRTNSVTHQVYDRAGNLVHQHQTHIGKYGTRREFPADWIQFPRVP